MKKILAGLVLISFLTLLVVPIMATAQVIPGEEQANECCRIRHHITELIPGEGAVAPGNIVGPSTEAPCNLAGGETDVDTVRVNWAAYCTIDTIYTVSDWVFWIVLVVSGIIIVAAGAMFMTAAGDPEKAGKARKILTYGVIGLIVAILAKFIPAIARYFISV